MSRGFELRDSADIGAGRTGRLYTPEAPQAGAVETPAFFPVLNLIGGPTPVSGGIWSRLRNRLFADEEFQGAMFQAMSFLDFNLSPEKVDRWRHEKQGLHEWFTDHDSPKDNPAPKPFTQPLFVDSGGFKLMNSRTFGAAPESGGEENEWGIYTNPKSILDLQYDYGADLLATLDYPIPPDLEEGERVQRIEDSIDSAVECLRLLEEDEKYDDWDPVVYAAIHGHSYDEVGYYVTKLLERTSYESTIDGFAVGSLVPLRSGNVGTLVDIVQGASQAIQSQNRDDIALHVFGIGGRLTPLLVALGVDSYDSSSYIQAAQHMDFIDPNSGSKVDALELNSDSWRCSCPACKELTEVGIEDMKTVFNADRSYRPIEIERDGETRSYMKSDFYALIGHHNFHVFQEQVTEVRKAVQDGRLREYLTKRAREDKALATGLARAANRWPELEDCVPAEVDIEENAPEEESKIFQTKFRMNGELYVPETSTSSQSSSTSLTHTPTDFDIREYTYSPDAEKKVCLILACSDTKPYRDSRTHREVIKQLEGAGLWDRIEKVSLSGLYGPVPSAYEEHDAVMTYDYVLTEADQSQVELIRDRLVEFLEEHHSSFDEVFAYVTSKTYRTTIDEAFTDAGVGTVLPTDPAIRRVTEHFRAENLDELVERVGQSLDSEGVTDS
jgi:queuine/archaeosine tRNA-ribosyltransferase